MRKKKLIPTWIVHCVYPDADMPHEDYQVNFHTHGLNRYNHPELAIVVAIPPEKAASILNSIGLRIANGERFDTEGKRYDVLDDDFPVQFVKTLYDGEEVMVVLLPDEERNLPGDDLCSEPYSLQLQFLDLLRIAGH